MNAPAPLANKMTFAEVETAARELGEQAGKGKDTQIKFGLKLVEGGYHSAIDVDRDKHGPGIDDATKLAEAYVKAQGSATVFDATAPNQRKLIACARTLIRCGMWPKGGSGEPLATVNKLMTVRGKLRQKPENATRLDDAFNTLMKYSRQQIRRDTVIPDTELEGLCFKKVPNEQTAEQIIEACRKKLIDVRNGKASHGTAKRSSGNVVAAIHALTKDLEEIAKERGNKKGASGTQPAPETV